MKNQKSNNNLAILKITVVVTFAVLLVVTVKNLSNSKNNSKIDLNNLTVQDEKENAIEKLTPQTFESKSISLAIPEGWQVEEKQTVIKLTKGEGEIKIIKMATNHSDLESHLNFLDSTKQGFSIEEQKQQSLSGYNTISRVELFESKIINDQKVYYIYVPQNVISLSTNNKSLYRKLDQIAQTFIYLGEQ